MKHPQGQRIFLGLLHIQFFLNKHEMKNTFFFLSGKTRRIDQEHSS